MAETDTKAKAILADLVPTAMEVPSRSCLRRGWEAWDAQANAAALEKDDSGRMMIEGFVRYVRDFVAD